MNFFVPLFIFPQNLRFCSWNSSPLWYRHLPAPWRLSRSPAIPLTLLRVWATFLFPAASFPLSVPLLDYLNLSRLSVCLELPSCASLTHPKPAIWIATGHHVYPTASLLSSLGRLLPLTIRRPQWYHYLHLHLGIISNSLPTPAADQLGHSLPCSCTPTLPASWSYSLDRLLKHHCGRRTPSFQTISGGFLLGPCLVEASRVAPKTPCTMAWQYLPTRPSHQGQTKPTFWPECLLPRLLASCHLSELHHELAVHGFAAGSPPPLGPRALWPCSAHPTLPRWLCACPWVPRAVSITAAEPGVGPWGKMTKTLLLPSRSSQSSMSPPY